MAIAQHPEQGECVSAAGEARTRFSSPQEEALLSILRSADCLQRNFQQRLKPYGLTSTQYNVLRILRGAEPDGLACSSIGRMMITAEPDITRLLGRLKAHKLVRQERDKHDRRVVWTFISEQGLDTLAALDGMVEQAPRELLGELNCTEVAELIRLLDKARCCSTGANPSSLSSSSRLSGTKASLSGKPSLPHFAG